MATVKRASSKTSRATAKKQPAKAARRPAAKKKKRNVIVLDGIEIELKRFKGKRTLTSKQIHDAVLKARNLRLAAEQAE